MILKIFYLHYNTKKSELKDRPEWFDYENCLINLLGTLEENTSNLYVQLNLVFDGDENSFNDDFSSKYFKLNDRIESKRYSREVYLINGGSAPKSSQILMTKINKDFSHGSDDLIYILENDYLHVQGWVSCVEDLVNSGIKFDYLSLYDHGDKYKYTENYWDKYDSLRSKIFVSKSRHWRTIPSTCFSFIVKAGILKKDYIYFNYLRDYYIQKFLQFFKGRVLLSSIPGLSTHCMRRYLSPLIDWREINGNIKKLDEKSNNI